MDIRKIISNMDMQILNLEIQLAQIQDDSAAKGALVAAEHLKKELEELRYILTEKR